MAYPVSRFMAKKVVTCTKEKRVLHAVKLMKKFRIGTVVVVEKQKVIGIITERDVLNSVAAKNFDAEKLVVKDVMTKNPVVGRHDMSDVQAAFVMNMKKIKKLPLLKNKKLAGIVTQTDLLRVFSSKWKV